MSRLYLAGPMRGIPNFNFPAFHEAAKLLRAEGHEVFSPAEKGEEAILTANPGLQENMDFRRKVFKLDLAWICEHADAVALLPGWEKSSGSRAEKAAAEAIGLTIIILGSTYHV
jgi:hypothetical protein